MYKINKKIILLIGLFPFMRFFLKFFYSWALNKVKQIANLDLQIKDVLLISKLDHKNFIYGSSDLNLLFIIQDEHPKRALAKIREEINKTWPANILVNTQELIVLKESELQTPLIRSFLMKKNLSNQVRWKSLLHKNFFEFNLNQQDHFSIQHNYLKNIDTLLLNIPPGQMITRHSIRSFAKNLYIAIKGLSSYNFLQGKIDPQWDIQGQKIIRFSLFRNNLFEHFKLKSLSLLNTKEASTQNNSSDLDIFPKELIQKLQHINKMPYIHDLLLIPALIQLDQSVVSGRLYIDIIYKAQTELSKNELLALFDYTEELTKEFREKNLKLIFNYTSFEILQLKNDYALGDTPLRSLYRKQQAESLNNFRYTYQVDKKQMERASIHFLLNRFMSFRTKELQRNLRGSKFIKSLNEIYLYMLLLEFLQGKEFALSHNFKSIMEDITVQLSHLGPNDIVTDQDWRIIRSQMLYYLKQIRDELAKRYSSLKNLQF